MQCAGKGEGARCLEVIVEREITAVLSLDLLLGVLLGAVHDTSLLVFTDALLEEVGLATQGDVLHEVEGVADLVDLLVAEGDEEAVSNELDVLLHQVGVHAEKSARQSLGQELLLNGDGISDDVVNHLLAGTVVEVRVEKAGEVSVETLITRDELVGEGQARHETTLLEPEDGGESSAEEDTLDSSKGDETLSKGGVLVLDPSDSPVGFLSDARDCCWLVEAQLKAFIQDLLVSMALKR